MGIPEFDTIEISLDGATARLLLNRPARRNALTHRMMTEIGQAVGWLAEEPAVRLLVLDGAGGNFCAGGDIAAMEQMPPRPTTGTDPLVPAYRQFGHALARLDRLPIPVIAMVEGAAVGGGFGMACCADIVIAGPTAKFGLPEPKAGFIPSQIIPFVVRTMGETAARHMAVTSAVIDAQTAASHGIVHYAECDRAAMQRRLEDLTAKIFAGAPAAIAAVKNLILDCAAESDDRIMDDAADALVKLLRSEDAAAGITAFFAKQPPPWSRL